VDPRHAREIGEALAFAMGDHRDEPLRCGFRDCESTEVERDLIEDAYRCRECARYTSAHVAATMRHERLRKRIEGGVGGPLLRLLGHS
jgi:hypothetical protein